MQDVSCRKEDINSYCNGDGDSTDKRRDSNGEGESADHHLQDSNNQFGHRSEAKEWERTCLYSKLGRSLSLKGSRNDYQHGRQNSFDNKEMVLVQVVLSSIATYYLSIFESPKTTLGRLFWGSKVDNRKATWVKYWSKVIRDNANGGIMFEAYGEWIKELFMDRCMEVILFFCRSFSETLCNRKCKAEELKQLTKVIGDCSLTYKPDKWVWELSFKSPFSC
ncbi:hypothetical protein OSB04_024468 [Centaurea solstitialis]|uniref:Uncharacterized protein n=1 Tax=Centaurea solstitialis TaxID=347529 RepID=A0AA38WDW0_9ASTR|nr:hypothetical protein OSB04_024468 [Centaurea solstitialis]